MSTNDFVYETINKKITRRSFVKWSAALGATASVSGLILQDNARKADAAVPHPSSPLTASNKPESVTSWQPSCCLVCHSWCAIAVGLSADGHVRKIEGLGGQPMNYVTVDSAGVVNGSTATPVGVCRVNAVGNLGTVAAAPELKGAGLQEKAEDANHIATGPGYLAYAPHNKGRICAKGTNGMEHMYDADRLKYPLERVGDRGAGKWKRVTWAYALRKMANVMRELAGFTTFYDLNVDSDLTLHAVTDPGIQHGLKVAPRGVDNRHRAIHWVGRNENSAPKHGFSDNYGLVNHIEHTSLCELSRHVAGRNLWGHHWSSPDCETHVGTIQWPNTGTVNTWGGPNAPSGPYVVSEDNDTDLYVEWGGNPCEAKIPHAACNTHLADRKRKNLEGYGAIGGTGRNHEARNGRIITIDVRQSNTAAYSDEYFQITPGEDGALALAMMAYLMDAGASGAGELVLKTELDAGQMGFGGVETVSDRRYYGLFTAEEGAPGGGTFIVPAGKSLESYLKDAGASGFAANLGAAPGIATILDAVAAKTGIAAEDIVYLARAIGGLPALNYSGASTGAAAATIGNWSGTKSFANATVDCYRGPVKHTNGVYNGLAIRCLQILAVNKAAGDFWSGGATPVVARGGYNSPGGFTSDKDWTPYSWSGSAGLTGVKYDKHGPQIKPKNPDIPDDLGISGDEHHPISTQAIDQWDYDYDMPRWRGSYKWVDQNLLNAIRWSIGLTPFDVGEVSFSGSYYSRITGSVVAGPYGNGNGDNNYKAEVIINHKNSGSYARPNSGGGTYVYTSKDAAGNYRLAHMWSIDISMGDATRFADIVLAEGTYLERFSKRSGEGQEFSYRPDAFGRHPVYEYTNGDGHPRHMYDVRQNKAIYYELARYVAHDRTSGGYLTSSPSGPADPTGGWDSLYDRNSWASAGETGNIETCSADANDGEWAAYDGAKQRTNATVPASVTGSAHVSGLATDSGYRIMRSHGYLWCSDDTPAYWRAGFTGGGEMSGTDTYVARAGYKPSVASGGAKLCVYNVKLDSLVDLAPGRTGTAADNAGAIETFSTKADGTFYGQARYLQPIQQPIGTAPGSVGDYPLHLTTYKLNVHTQSRTANLPRLQEIIGGSWAVMHPDTAALYGVVNGDRVEISSRQSSMYGEAKVTPKAQRGCVHISHSQGHRAGVEDTDFTGALDGGNKYNDAYGMYLIKDGFGYKENRSMDTDAIVDDYRKNLPPSAPGKGIHPNPLVENALPPAGVSATGGPNCGKNMAACAISGSVAWMDTKVQIKKA